MSDSVREVELGAGQIFASTQSLSEGATEQASSLEEISASMGDIDSRTKANADHAGQASSLANSTKEAAESGVAGMRSLLGAMTEIDSSSAQIATACVEQAQGVSQIGAGLSQLDNLTQRNASGAEEMASASEDLSNRARQLRGRIDEFKLTHASGTLAPILKRRAESL